MFLKSLVIGGKNRAFEREGPRLKNYVTIYRKTSLERNIKAMWHCASGLHIPFSLAGQAFFC